MTHNDNDRQCEERLVRELEAHDSRKTYQGGILGGKRRSGGGELRRTADSIKGGALSEKNNTSVEGRGQTEKKTGQKLLGVKVRGNCQKQAVSRSVEHGLK